MTFDKDFFCLHGGPRFVTSRVGLSGFDDPSWHAPYADHIPRGNTFTWQFPRAASLKQLVVSNWPFGSQGEGPFEDTAMSMVILDDTTLTTATNKWNVTQRVDDRGTVWDINTVVAAGGTLSIALQGEKGGNSNTNQFVIGITGTWLR